MQGTFYNDMRNAAAEDYSFAIRQFCSQRGIKVPCSAPPQAPACPPGFLQSAHRSNNDSQPQAEHMEKTLFSDLCLRVSVVGLMQLHHSTCCGTSNCPALPWQRLLPVHLLFCNSLFAKVRTGSNYDSQPSAVHIKQTCSKWRTSCEDFKMHESEVVKKDACNGIALPMHSLAAVCYSFVTTSVNEYRLSWER